MEWEWEWSGVEWSGGDGGGGGVVVVWCSVVWAVRRLQCSVHNGHSRAIRAIGCRQIKPIQSDCVMQLLASIGGLPGTLRPPIHDSVLKSPRSRFRGRQSTTRKILCLAYYISQRYTLAEVATERMLQMSCFRRHCLISQLPLPHWRPCWFYLNSIIKTDDDN